MTGLRQYAWPGNVRELRQTIERCVLMAEGKTLTAADLPSNIRHGMPDTEVVTVKGRCCPTDGPLWRRRRRKRNESWCSTALRSPAGASPMPPEGPGTAAASSTA